MLHSNNPLFTRLFHNLMGLFIPLNNSKVTNEYRYMIKLTSLHSRVCIILTKCVRILESKNLLLWSKFAIVLSIFYTKGLTECTYYSLLKYYSICWILIIYSKRKSKWEDCLPSYNKFTIYISVVLRWRIQQKRFALLIPTLFLIPDPSSFCILKAQTPSEPKG